MLFFGRLFVVPPLLPPPRATPPYDELLVLVYVLVRVKLWFNESLNCRLWGGFVKDGDVDVASVVVVVGYFWWLRSLSISMSSSFCVNVSFCCMAKRNNEFNVFFSSSAAVNCRCSSSICDTYSSHRAVNIARSVANVAASSFNVFSSFLSFCIVSVTTSFSFSYLLFKLASATSAVCLFALRTVRNVAICSRLVDNNDFSLII